MADLSNEAAEALAQAAYRAYTSLRTEQMQDGRVYPAWDELALNERFAWESAGVAAAGAERERVRQAVLSCLTCGRVHTCRQVPGPPGKPPGWTWSDPQDGHTYRPAHLASPGPAEALSAALGDGDG